MREHLRTIGKEESGMTLVEVMTGFAILAIVMVISLSILLFSGKVLSKEGARDRLKMLGDEMYRSLSSKLIFATHLQLLPPDTDPDQAKYDNVIFIRDGLLYHGPKGGPYELYYTENVYQNTRLTLSTEAKSETVLSLQLGFQKEEGEIVYETASSFRLINLAAGTDPVYLEGSVFRTDNPVVSYDSHPYEIEENAPAAESGPYTVKCYAEGKDILSLEEYRWYERGDIVEYQGKKWQVVQGFLYNGAESWSPGHPGNYLWKSLEEDWNSVNSGYSGKSVYEYYDVVSYEGAYYMSIYPLPFLNISPPEKGLGWTQVYWFPEKEEQADRMLGWSLTEKTYTSIYEDYPKQ